MTGVHVTVASLIDRLDHEDLSETEIIRWGSPVPVFGDISSSTIATVGLNPSSREFIDESGTELDGPERRFHTLNSLGLSSWLDVDARHLDQIVDAYHSYFDQNPYDTWFKKLESVLSGTNASFYDSSRKACHLDVIPFATMRRWADLQSSQHSLLLSSAGNSLGILLRDSPIRTLILNGRSVVHLFEAMAGVRLAYHEMPAWSLPRQSGDVMGIAYSGKIEGLLDVNFDHEISVIGFNHNLQSSFGVTTAVIEAIASWIGEVSTKGLS